MSASMLFTRAHSRSVSNAVEFIRSMENPFPFAEMEDLTNDPTSSDTDSTTTTDDVFDVNETDSSMTDTNETASCSNDLGSKVKRKSSADDDRRKAIEERLDKMDFTNWAQEDIINACIDAWYDHLKPPASSNESPEGEVYDNTWANSEFADGNTLELISPFGDSILDPQPESSQRTWEMPYHWDRPPRQYLSQTITTQRRDPRYINAFFGRDLNKIKYYQGAADFMHRRTMTRLDSVHYKPTEAFNKRFRPAKQGRVAFDIWKEHRRHHGLSKLWWEHSYA